MKEKVAASMARLAAAPTSASQAPESSARATAGRGSSHNADLAAKCARLEKELREARKHSEGLDVVAKRSEREKRRLTRDVSSLKDEVLVAKD